MVNISRCQHIKVNGMQCGSPALKRNRFCFFHKRWHEQRIVINSAKTRKARAALDLPVLEDANSIQVALMQVMRLLLRGQFDTKTAGMLFYALQTASSNLRHTSFETLFKTKIVIDPRRVHETELEGDPWNEEDYEEEEDGEEEDEPPQVATAIDRKAEDAEVEEIEAGMYRRPAMKNPPSKEAIRREIRNAVIKLLPPAVRPVPAPVPRPAPQPTMAVPASPVLPAPAPSPSPQEEARAEQLLLHAEQAKAAALRPRKKPPGPTFFSLPRERTRNGIVR